MPASPIGFYGFAPPRDAFGRAKRAAESAIGLDDGLAEAHVSMALVHFWFDWDAPRAEREFRRSLSINPNQVTARIFLGQMLAALGRSREAEPEWRTALELDPLSPLTHGIVGAGLYLARRYEEGVARCRRALEIDPNHIQSLFALTVNAAQLGRHNEAVAAAEQAAALSGRTAFFVGVLGLALAGAGRRREAQAALDELQRRSEHEYVPPLLRAWILAALGDVGTALDCLEQAHAERNSMVFFAAAMRELDVLRGDPRFAALMRQIGLPPASP